MFAGHYAAGLALKKIDRKASLGLLFLGVLWNNAVATYAIESAFLAAGLCVYFRSTTGTSFIGRYGMGLFVVILLLINAIIFRASLRRHKSIIGDTSACDVLFICRGGPLA